MGELPGRLPVRGAMQTAQKFLHIITLIVTWSMLFGSAALMLPKLIGYSPYVVLSGSMEPTVKTGSLAYISTTDMTPTTGSVIAYELSDGTAIIHRIVGVDEETGNYITKGDANETADGTPVPKESILGLYIFSIPCAGYLLQMLKTPFLLPVFSLVCIILALNLADYGNKGGLLDV
ncbi:MAG: signal peptidase I [Lachnospiraceae bacterium]|nr:signal peptidase I [Lachnospiraceae bacterium]